MIRIYENPEIRKSGYPVSGYYVRGDYLQLQTRISVFLNYFCDVCFRAWYLPLAGTTMLQHKLPVTVT